MSFKSFFEAGTLLKPLEAGKYEVTLKSATFQENPEDPSKSYVRVELQFPDRVVVDNRFEKGFGIMLSQIRKQLGKADESMAVQDILAEAQAVTLEAWVSYNVVDGKTYQNINYLPPLPTVSATDVASQINLDELPL